jgi:DEAD/DEAH box helicase domain-containing protein
MDVPQFIERMANRRYYRGQMAHMEEIPAREAVFEEVPGGLSPRVRQALASQGINRLYSHQARAIGSIREGRNVVIVTGTASGKTLCYNIPVVESLAEHPLATMLFIYPTKALAQDQLRAIGRFQPPQADIDFMAGTYDGDTPTSLRRKLRDGGNVILTNPDMLHQGILPHHARWNKFFTHLKYVVIDEVHAYRGVFGSHLANVIRRLRRICEHYDAAPQFVCCSATIANPEEHAARIIGDEVVGVTNDGSPRGPKYFVLWNPPPLETAARGSQDDWRVGGDRRSPIGEAVNLMTDLVKDGVQTIAFVRTRLASELIYKSVRDRLRRTSRRLAEGVTAYRGGYLPEERREIERRLAEREVMGVASTNALELGIDIGTLDACILVGYPGSIASLWQQAGRAGRGLDASVVFLCAQNSPMDQYLMAYSNYIFEQNPEHAVVDPDNPHVAVGHLKCAAHELPLGDDELDRFGPYAEIIMELLEEDELVSHLKDRWYWASSEYPAANVDLRNIAGPVYTIQDEARGERVIGTLDEVSALSQLFTHAVYLHGGNTYFVNELDIEQKIVHVERRDIDYYTQSVQSSQIQIDESEEVQEWAGATVGFGDVTVTTTIPMFKKIKFHSRDSLGYEKLELPPQSLETVATWLAPPEELVRRMQAEGMVVGQALIGIANVIIEVAPLFVMCDPSDIGTVVNSSSLKRDALFLHDRYPGGMGYARRCMESIEPIMQTVHRVVQECACEDGCPSCVGSPIPPHAASDLDSAVRGRIPDKQAALHVLNALLGE